MRRNVSRLFRDVPWNFVPKFFKHFFNFFQKFKHLFNFFQKFKHLFKIFFIIPHGHPYALTNQLNFVNWNKEGWKVGLCNVPPSGQPFSLLGIHNTTAVVESFVRLRSRFTKLYKRKGTLFTV